MKKLLALLVSVYIATAMILPVSAKTDKELWLSYTKKGDTLCVEIQTAGNIADGLSEITYPDFVTYEKAEKADTVDMSSVHSNDKSSVKVDYIAEESMKKGTIYTLIFKIDKKHVKDEISIGFKSEVHDKDGKELVAEDGNIVIPKDETNKPVVPDPDPEKPTKPNDKPGENGDKKPNTGDDTNTAVLLGGMAIAVGAMAAARKKRAHR